MTIENIQVNIVGSSPSGDLYGEVYFRGTCIEIPGPGSGEVADVLCVVEEWLYARDIELRSSWKYDTMTGKFVVVAKVPEEWTYGGL